MARVRKHPDVRRNEILDVAHSLFIEDGFEKVLSNRGFSTIQVRLIIKRLSELRITAINQYYRKRGIYFGGKAYNP